MSSYILTTTRDTLTLQSYVVLMWLW